MKDTAPVDIQEYQLAKYLLIERYVESVGVLLCIKILCISKSLKQNLKKIK